MKEDDDLTGYLKFLLPFVVGLISFYIIYAIQGFQTALILVAQNMFTLTVLYSTIDSIKHPEKITKHINNIRKNGKKTKNRLSSISSFLNSL